jgi:hypothetical protein
LTLAVLIALDLRGTSAYITLLMSDRFTTGACGAVEDLVLLVTTLEWEVAAEQQLPLAYSRMPSTFVFLISLTSDRTTSWFRNKLSSLRHRNIARHWH